MSHTSSLHSSVQAYINYVSELQESINNILHIQRRVEQNLNSIVENETYLDLRRSLNTNRYSTNNLNRNVNVSMPSPTNIQQTNNIVNTCLAIKEYSGKATVESYTMMYDSDGSPGIGHVSCLLENGTRTWANCNDKTILEAMIKEEFCGKPVMLSNRIASF